MSTRAVTIEDQAAECEREVAMRRRVYARWSENGKMTAEQAQRGIDRMEAAATTLRRLADAEKAKGDLFGAAQERDQRG